MLSEKRQAIYDKAKSLLDNAAAEKRELTPDESRDYNTLSESLDSLRSQIDRVAENDASNTATEAALRALADKAVDPKSGYKALENGNTDKRWLPTLAEYRELQTEQRAIGTTGAFIPVDYSSVWFDQIRTRVGVLNAGPVLLPVDNAGSVKVPLVNSSVTVAGVAEGGSITPSDPGVTSITLDPKKFAAYTLVDREAVEDSNPKLLTIVENSLVKDFAVKLDQELANGDGTGQNLLGLLGVAGVTAGPSLGANGASLSATAGFGYLADSLSAYESANNDPDRAAWLMNSRSWASIRKIADAQSRPIFAADPTQAVRPTLFGKPVFISNNIPVTQTVGTSTDCSTILLVDFSQIVVAVSRQVELMMSTDVAFQTDQVALRVTGRFDIGAPQPTAIVKTVGVRQ